MEGAPTLDRIGVAANENRFDDAVTIFLRDEARIPGEQLSLLQGTPVWANMVALAPQSVREWEHLVEATVPVDRYEGIAVPTLLLTGTETEYHPSFATHALEAALPDARIAMLEGQGHGGNRGAPDLLAAEVTSFILETSRYGHPQSDKERLGVQSEAGSGLAGELARENRRARLPARRLRGQGHGGPEGVRPPPGRADETPESTRRRSRGPLVQSEARAPRKTIACFSSYPPWSLPFQIALTSHPPCVPGSRLARRRAPRFVSHRSSTRSASARGSGCGRSTSSA